MLYGVTVRCSQVGRSLNFARCSRPTGRLRAPNTLSRNVAQAVSLCRHKLTACATDDSPELDDGCQCTTPESTRHRSDELAGSGEQIAPFTPMCKALEQRPL